MTPQFQLNLIMAVNLMPMGFLRNAFLIHNLYIHSQIYPHKKRYSIVLFEIEENIGEKIWIFPTITNSQKIKYD